MKKIPALTAAIAGAAILGVSGCAATGDIVISEDPENRGELIADYSHTFTITAQDINSNARMLPDGFDFDCTILENQFEFNAAYSVSKQGTTERQSCTFDFENLTLPALSEILSSSDNTGSIEVFHVEEEGYVVIEANDALSDGAQEVVDELESEIDGYESEDVEDNVEENSTDDVNEIEEALNNQSSELVFEFPGNIVSATDGSLIAQRDYDGSVDRTRLVNQDVGSANIIHLEGSEVFSDFQIVAEDGLSAAWWQWVLWIGGSVLGIAALVLAVLIIVARKRDNNTKFSKYRNNNRDPHAATLENPDGDKNFQAEKKKSQLPKTNI